MTKDEQRAAFVAEMDSALERLKKVMPHLDAELGFRWGLGYFAEQYARTFGHPALADLLSEKANLADELAAQELEAPRH
jgi:hypothetical protein